MPRMSDTMEEGTIVSWHKKVGDKVNIGDLLAEIETDKATMDFESPAAGTLLYIGAKEGQAVPIDAILAIIGEKGENIDHLLKEAAAPPQPQKETPSSSKESAPVAVAPAPKASAAQSSSTERPDNGRIKASPLARRMARERGLSLEQIKGTGDQGRIIKRDVEAATTSRSKVVPASAGVQQEAYEDIPLTQMRKTIAKRLAASKFSAPHFYLTVELNMDRAIAIRKDLNAVLPVKISFNDLIIKAAALALRQHPEVNASWMDDRIRRYRHVHIGMAVAVDEGLLVPVIRFADSKGIAAIAEETGHLAEKAKAGTLKLDEMQGNTFTVSNLGMFDIDQFTAIINSPESCILAVGRIRQAPVVQDGNITVAHVMKVTLSCDHRVVDGATGARFLQTFRRYLENPAGMLVL
ncbi:MAG: dihydrolipoamide acetyltransferase component of pyruvate dehydrogenase complex [Chitinophagales bacterium]|nr:MAG: dihydrolipoamide acetyltransferase component of pyruvate dehydrogenase complex [Chitinophagales bacterium]